MTPSILLIMIELVSENAIGQSKIMDTAVAAVRLTVPEGRIQRPVAERPMGGEMALIASFIADASSSAVSAPLRPPPSVAVAAKEAVRRPSPDTLVRLPAAPAGEVAGCGQLTVTGTPEPTTRTGVRPTPME